MIAIIEILDRYAFHHHAYKKCVDAAHLLLDPYFFDFSDIKDMIILIGIIVQVNLRIQYAFGIQFLSK